MATIHGLHLSTTDHRQFMCAVCESPVEFFSSKVMDFKFQSQIKVRCHGKEDAKKIDMMDSRNTITFFE